MHRFLEQPPHPVLSHSSVDLSADLSDQTIAAVQVQQTHVVQPHHTPLRIGQTLEQSTPVELPLHTMLRHFVCLGASGSGKTVACKVLVEEMLFQGIPGIAIDPQGDIASMLLPTQVDTSISSTASEPHFHQHIEVVVWTPGSGAGIPLALDPLRLQQLPIQAEERTRVLSTMAANLASLLGYPLDSHDGSFASAYLDLVLQYLAEHPVEMNSLADLCGFLQNLPQPLAEQADRVIRPNKRDELTRKLEVLGVGARRLLFQWGTPLSIETLLGLDHTKTARTETGTAQTRLSIIYLNSLQHQEEKEFFVAHIAQALYDWMLDHPSALPQAFFYMDEIAPFLPPVRKPACKDSLKLLFKQARKYGVCCLIASQNPGDIDYMALSQFSTWGLGRMMVQQDIKKIERILRSLSPDQWEWVVERLPRLEPGQFLLLCPDVYQRVVTFEVRWLKTRHETLDEERIAALTPHTLREKLAASGRLPSPLSPHAPQFPAISPQAHQAEESHPTSSRQPPPHTASPEREDQTSSAPSSLHPPTSRLQTNAPQTSPPSSSILAQVEQELATDAEIFSDTVDTVIQEDSPRTQSLQEIPPSTYEAIILEFFSNCPGAYTAKELTHETALSEKLVRRALQCLLERGELVTVKVSRSQLYWPPTDHFAPTVGVVRPILTASLQADRDRAFALAHRECASSLFGLYRRETVQGPSLQYLLLWRVVLLSERERGLWRKVREPIEQAVYFHATQGDLVVLDDQHVFHFRPLGSEEIESLQDLATFATWQPRTPADLGFTDKDLLVLKSPQAIKAQCDQHLVQPIRQIRLVALPYWCFSLCRPDGKKRTYRVDAVFGQPLTLPIS